MLRPGSSLLRRVDGERRDSSRSSNDRRQDLLRQESSLLRTGEGLLQGQIQARLLREGPEVLRASSSVLQRRAEVLRRGQGMLRSGQALLR